MKFKLLRFGVLTLSLLLVLGVSQCIASFNCESTDGYTVINGVCMPDPNEVEGPQGLPKYDTVTEVIVRVITFILGFLGSLAVLMIIIGGVMYMVSAGDEKKLDTAKSLLTYAIYGLIIVLFAYVIVYIISKALGAI